MRIAFYAPLKSPHHPVPSGDRAMARMLIAALEHQGHKVDLISELRSYSSQPDAAAYAAIEARAQGETERISDLWAQAGRPDLWLSYHPYYKAPDLLGPGLTQAVGVPYATVETSYSERRNLGHWTVMQDRVLRGIECAAVNICLTTRDRDGVLLAAPAAQVAMLPPFINAKPFLTDRTGADVDPYRMITVAMMRPGDKLNSYKLLANALGRVSADLPWSLSIIGDGTMRAEVAEFFTGFGDRRIIWHGEAGPVQIAELMTHSALYVWPGYGEAYGLAYLEAQAAGLPVVAQRTAGVPEVVQDGVTGILTAVDDPGAFAQGIERLLNDQNQRKTMGTAARQFVLRERTLDRAAQRLDQILRVAENLT